MKTIVLLGVLFLVAIRGTEAHGQRSHTELLDIINKLSDYRHHGHGHPVVGFSASLFRHFTGGKANDRVVFETEQTNIGHGYNRHSGIFTAPVNGMYIFQWNILTNHKRKGDTYLLVNGIFKRANNCNSMYHGPGFGHRNGSASVVLALRRNDRVWITTHKGYYIRGLNWSSFQGWLQREM